MKISTPELILLICLGLALGLIGFLLTAVWRVCA